MHTYDLLVLGGGPAGYAAALRASRVGKTVALCDRSAPGGTCLYRGCIPTKAMIAAAQRWRQARTGSEFGLEIQIQSAAIAAVTARTDTVIATLCNALTRSLTGAGITLYRGAARLTGPRELTITTPEGETVVGGETVLLAPGSRPAVVPGLAADGRQIITSDDIWGRTRLPERLLIVGGGFIGCEFASLMAGFGVGVTLVEMAPRLLPVLDRDLGALFLRSCKKQGIAVRLAAKVTDVAVTAGRVSTQVEDAQGTAAWSGDTILVATGRVPATDGLGLEEQGIAMDARGAIAVNERLATSQPGVFAAGDAIGDIQLAHAASLQGEIVADNMTGAGRTYSGKLIPSAVFTDPEIGSVGLSEAAARQEAGDVLVGKVPYRALGRAHASGALDGLFKVIARADDGVLLGIHIAGERATDLLAAGAVALRAGMTVGALAETVQAHPTLAEGVRDACHAAVRARR